MGRDGSGVAALPGLDGFVMCAQLLDDASGEWWLAVETSDDRTWCPSGGVRAVGHGRRHVVVRDLALADRPVVLVWAKRLWRCADPANLDALRAAARALWTRRPAGSVELRWSATGTGTRLGAGLPLGGGRGP